MTRLFKEEVHQRIEDMMDRLEAADSEVDLDTIGEKQYASVGRGLEIAFSFEIAGEYQMGPSSIFFIEIEAAMKISMEITSKEELDELNIAAKNVLNEVKKFNDNGIRMMVEK